MLIYPVITILSFLLWNSDTSNHLAPLRGRCFISRKWCTWQVTLYLNNNILFHIVFSELSSQPESTSADYMFKSMNFIPDILHFVFILFYFRIFPRHFSTIKNIMQSTLVQFVFTLCPGCQPGTQWNLQHVVSSYNK